MSKGIVIQYGNIAPEAKENFNIDTSEKKFNTLENLKKYNMKLYNYANPCELYQTMLDGSAKLLPSDISQANIGLWSKQLSDDDGIFKEPITITLTSVSQYSSTGITLSFDTFNDIYPTNLNIKWYRVADDSEELLSDMDFEPNSSYYYFRNQVENFNKIIITFYALNMPSNRLKVETIDYGYNTILTGAQLRNVKITQSIDPISSELKIDTCDFTIDNNTNASYLFQTNQPLSVQFNGNNIATYFVKSAKRKSKSLWDIQSEDYIGVMDNVSYAGGIYTNEIAGLLLEDIFTVAKVPYSIADEFYDIRLRGYIGYTTCREALMQVCFASMAVVTVSGNSGVEVKSLEDDIKQTIPLSRIMEGQSFEYSNTVTSVELTAHQYVPITETSEVYKADDIGTGENIFVKFSEPLHNLTITNGTILDSGYNYAIINANDECILIGQKYNHTQYKKQLKNPLVLASEQDNVISITNATLVNQYNIDRILEKCYTWLTKTETTNVKIVVGKNVSKKIIDGEIVRDVTNQEDINIGDMIECETDYCGNVTGRVINQSFNLNGNIVVKECKLK